MSFLSLEHVDLADLGRVRGALHAIRGGELGGVVIENAYDADALARIDAGLTARRPHFPTKDLPGFDDLDARPFLDGHSIVDTDPGLADYLDAAARLPAELDRAFAGATPFVTLLEDAVSVLLDGAPVALATTADGRPYAPCTIRELPHGHEIGLHIGNAFLCMPQAADLAARVAVDAQISFFMPLRRPERGGQLRVYDLRWDAVKEQYLRSTASVRQLPQVVVQFVELVPHLDLDPEPGTLVVFDGGRFYHRVLRVGGPVARRTIGGFLAWERDGRGVRYWS